MNGSTLGEFVTFVSGGTPSKAKSEFYGGDLPWITGADIKSVDRFEPRSFLTPSAEAKTGILAPGDLALVTRTSVGKVAIAKQRTAFSQDITGIKLGKNLEARYVARFLEARSMDLVRHARGATIKGVTRKDVASLSFSPPSLDEQRRIAAILDKADAIRTKRRQVLASLDTLPVAAFVERFGDPDQASRTISLGEIATLVGGRNLVAEDQSQETPFRVLKISSVTSGVFRPSESKALPPDYVPPSAHMVHPGDLLMSRANTAELVGATAMADEVDSNLALPDKIWKFVWLVPDIEPLFMHTLLSIPTMRRRISRLASGTGGSMKNVPKEKLMRMLIPDIKVGEQRSFADAVRGMHRLRADTATALAADDALFASLQSRAFKGEL